MTTTDSNVWEGRSGHIYTLTRQPDGRTSVDVIMIREGKNTKGRLLEILLETIGKHSLARTLASTVKAIEARNYQVSQADGTGAVPP